MPCVAFFRREDASSPQVSYFGQKTGRRGLEVWEFWVNFVGDFDGGLSALCLSLDRSDYEGLNGFLPIATLRRDFSVTDRRKEVAVSNKKKCYGFKIKLFRNGRKASSGRDIDLF